jgi:cephalosporin hydroxylase
MNQEVVDKFHIEYETNRMWENMFWMGTPIWKMPFDAFAIQDLIYKLKPDYVIETGTAFGGSALFYASMLKLLNHGEVITVDIEKKAVPETNEIWKEKVISFIGSSIDDDIFSEIKTIVENKKNIVLLDSWHTKEHVLKELQLYSQLIPVNSYIIVEDTHVNGHPVPWKWGEGPYEAVFEFLRTHDNFAIDKDCEKLVLTNNPSGYLKRLE